MARAFECDRCETFHEGAPNIRGYRALKRSSFGGYLSDERILTVELCPDCVGRLDEILETFVDGARFEQEGH